MLTVVKIGGNIIDDKMKLDCFIADFCKLEGQKILVHGGGMIATELGVRLDIQPNYIEGRRVTDRQTLDLVTMVYAGLLNKNIVAALQAYDCNAIGLTGADANIITSVKRPVETVDYGYVGDITPKGVNNAQVKQFLDIGLVPVIASLTHDGKGNLLNTNADTIAKELAIAMAKLTNVQLIYCFEKNGVLLNAGDDTTVISRITIHDFEKLKSEGVISGGMIPKVSDSCDAAKAGVKRVVIGNAAHLNNIIFGKSGTEIL